jgi:hypothetical protein
MATNSLADGNFNLQFITVPNLTYRVEYKADLADAAWISLSNFVAISTSFNLATPATNGTGFYRVTVQP